MEAGSATEAIAGAGAIVLGILGLLGILSLPLAAIGMIAVGAGLIAAGGTIAGRYEALLLSPEPTPVRREVAGGMGMEAIAGAGAVVLGILALLGRNPITLLAASAITIGAGLLMAGGSMARLESRLRWEVARRSSGKMEDVVYASSGSELIVGVGAIILGILALTGIDPLTLALVAVLSIGASLLMSGSSMASRLFGMFR
jgi:hypothetical protein